MSSSANQPGWTPPQPKPDRGFEEELSKRMGEGGVALGLAMRAVAVQDQQRMLAMHANRLCQDHRIQQMAAGYRDKEDGIDCPNGEEDMGDISITGDQYSYQVPTTTTTQASWIKPVLAAVLGAAIPAVGILGYLLAQKPETKPVDNNTDTISVVRIVE